MGINFDNFISGLAFGMSAGNPFFRGMGCCGGGGFGLFSNTVDFGTFANPFPSIFPPTQNGGMAAPPVLTNFANPTFPALDFEGPCRTIWDTFTNPDSEYNKQMREMYKQMEEQASKNYTQNKQQYIPQMQFPFSSFFMPPQISMNPFMTGFWGDYFTPVKPEKTEKIDKTGETSKVDNKSKVENSSSIEQTQTYTSKYSNDTYFSKMLAFILKQEGGYVNHPNDRGGATNMGVTQTTYNGYRKGKGLPSKDVKYITREEVEEIYHNIYVQSGADKITNPKLAMCVLDWAVHSGAKNESLQRALKECGGDVNKFIESRSNFLHRLIAKDSSQEVFRNGWDNRIRSLSSFVTEFPSSYA